MFSIACQTITFGDDMHKTDMPAVVSQVAESGYQGLEIGFRRLDVAKKEEYAQLFKDNGLQLVAIHIGGDYLDAESVKRQMQSIPVVIELAQAMACSNVFVSGTYRKLKSAEEYKREGENFNEIGRMLRGEGLDFCYHNHAWEIENGAQGLRLLLEHADPEYLSLVPDVGWITQGGQDPVRLLQEVKPRIRHVHFKEFTSEGGFTELGRGIVDFAAVWQVIADLENAWIIAEQDKSTIGVANSIRHNRQFIADLQLGKNSSYKE